MTTQSSPHYSFFTRKNFTKKTTNKNCSSPEGFFVCLVYRLCIYCKLNPEQVIFGHTAIQSGNKQLFQQLNQSVLIQ